MSGRKILEQALKLRPKERFMVVEGLIKSLDEPDSTIDTVWAEEAEKRLKAYRAGALEGFLWRIFSRKTHEGYFFDVCHART